MVALDDPRLHTVRLLRHSNVHLETSKIGETSRRAVWPGPSGDVEFEHEIFFAKNIGNSIRATRDAPRYTAGDLSAMIQWIDHEQRDWGLPNVVLRAAEEYVLELQRRGI